MPTHVPVETNPQNIRAIADELTRAADELRASADAITSAGFDCLEVVNFGVLKKVKCADYADGAGEKSIVCSLFCSVYRHLRQPAFSQVV